MSSPFAPGSFWTARADGDVPLDPASDTYVAELIDQIDQYYGKATLNYDTYSTPIYTVDADQPTTDVGFHNCQDKNTVANEFIAQLRDIPIPDHAVPAPGTDAAMVIWQPATDTMWDLWKVQRHKGGVRACWGGRLDDVSTTNGVYPRPYGTSASGVAMYHAIARIDELQAGRINHMVGLSLPRIRADEFVWPANRTDGRHPGARHIPEGQRFRLDPDLDLDTLDLHPIARTYADAIQRYGLIVRDISGVVAFGAENPIGVTAAGEPDPYPALLDDTRRIRLFDNFPWRHLQAIDPQWGRAG